MRNKMLEVSNSNTHIYCKTESMRALVFVLCLSVVAWAGFAETKPELVVQEGNNSAVDYLRYSNDGKYIMGATNHEAKIYNADTGVLVKSFNLGLFKDFSPDARYIAANSGANNDLSIYLFDIKTREKTVIGNKYSSASVKMAFSPDGSKLAVPMEKWVDIYDVNTHKTTPILKNSGYYFYDRIAWSADGTLLAIITGRREHKHGDTVLVYHLPTNRIINTYDANGKKVNYVAMSADGKYFAWALTTMVGIKEVNDTSKNFQSFNMPSEKGKICGLQFSSDNSELLAAQKDSLATCTLGTGKVRKRNFTWPTYSLACAPHRKEYAVGQHQKIVVYGDGGTAVTKEIGGASRLFCVHYNRNADSLVACNVKTDIPSVFDGMLNRMETPKNLPASTPFFALFDDGFYWHARNNTQIMRYTYAEGKSKKIADLKDRNAGCLVSNADGSLLAIYDKNVKRTYIYAAGGKKLKEQDSFESPEMSEVFSCFSPDSNFLFIKDDKAVVYDVQKKKIVLSLVNVSTANFSGDSAYLAVYNSGSTIDLYRTDTWACVHSFPYSALDPFFSSDGKILAISSYGDNTGWNMVLYSVPSWQEIKRIPIPFTSLRNFFSNDGQRIITFEDTGIIRCRSMQTGELLASALADGSGNWLTYTPEGYFTGNEFGLNNFVHFVNGMEVTGLDQLAETLFRPDLVAAKLRGEDISKQEGTSSLTEIVSSGDAPLVQFSNPPASASNRDITVNFSVQDAGGGIGAVYLKINGKVIQLADGSRKLELIGGTANTTQKSSGKTTQFSHLLTLQNGENTLEAYATNAAGKIESRHAVAKISWQGSTAKPNLYVLAVGVNKYRDKSLWLNYAVPDATSIADQFRSVKGNLYQSVNVTTVFDGDVTADGISSAFNSLAGKVGADDVFIFYLSGHGTTHTDGDYYFIPVDFRFRNAQSVPETAVSKHFITEQLSKIKAQKTLVMLDTCNSGAFISTGARGMAEKTAIDRLSRATGQATIAASSDTQSAMEGYEGHGIFTFVILEGLSGKADANKDGYVSLSELSQYAEEKVPDYSYAKWGYEQYPQVDLRKQSNFPLVGK